MGEDVMAWYAKRYTNQQSASQEGIVATGVGINARTHTHMLHPCPFSNKKLIDTLIPPSPP